MAWGIGLVIGPTLGGFLAQVLYCPPFDVNSNEERAHIFYCIHSNQIISCISHLNLKGC